VIAQYPTTTGSDHDPLPIGDWRVIAIVHNPWFFYNPELFWDAGQSKNRSRTPESGRRCLDRNFQRKLWDTRHA
jgi:hypothetical protein